MQYDPRDLGAECDRCPMGPNGPVEVRGSSSWCPVPSSHYSGAISLAVAETPGQVEEQELQTLIGPSGKLLDLVLRQCGRGRAALSRANIEQCRPPANDYKSRDRHLNALNKDRAKAKIEPWPHPSECCFPRLVQDVQPYKHVIVLGTVAAQKLLGTRQTITKLQGGPIELSNGRCVMPTVHPAFVLRRRREFNGFRADIAKALRWATTGLQWEDPWMDLYATPSSLQAFFEMARRSSFKVHDVEANGIDPLYASLRCVAFCTPPMEGPCSLCQGNGGAPSWYASWFAQYLSLCQEGEGAVGQDAFIVEVNSKLDCLARGKCPVCKGLGGGVHKRAINVPILSVDERTRFYTPADERTMWRIIADEFQSGHLLVGHNSLIYDSLMLRRPEYAGVLPGVTPDGRPRHLDTLPAAHLLAPECSKSLGALGRIFLDIRNWKLDNEGQAIAIESKDDRRLHVYCIFDTGANAEVVQPVIQGVQSREQARPLDERLRPKSWKHPWTLVGVGHFAQENAAGLHWNGIWIDREAQQRHTFRLRREIETLKRQVVGIAHSYGVRGPIKRKRDGPTDFNPNSTFQMGDLLFGKCRLEPIEMTESGRPSTKYDVILELLALEDLDPKLEQFLKLTVKLRRATKGLSTFVDPLVPMDVKLQRRWMGVQSVDELEWLYAKDEDPWTASLPDWAKPPDETEIFDRGLIQKDGRVHADWSTWPAPLRYACRRNNQMNVPYWARDMYAAPPGYVLVGADLAQAHLRIIANTWKIPILCECYSKGWNPYTVYADRIFFGPRYRRSDGWGPDGFGYGKKPKKGTAARLYKVAKVLVLSGAYRAGFATLHGILRRSEEKDGSLPFLRTSEDYVKGLRQQQLEQEPEWDRAWRYLAWKRYCSQGWLEEPIFGRRCDFLDLDPAEVAAKFGPGISDLSNWLVLPAEQAIMKIIESRLVAAFPFGYAGPGTGMVNQMHDSVALQVPERDAERAKRIVEEAFIVKVPGHDIEYKSDGAAVGRTLAEV